MADANHIELPPLPQPGMRPQHWLTQDIPAYAPSEMRSYAEQARLAERERIARLVEDGEPLAGPYVHDIARAIRSGK